MEPKRITAAQIETCRVTLGRILGRKKSDVKTLIFPHFPVTKKPLGVRMGSGKGNVDYFVAFVKAGTMLFEFSENLHAKQAFKAVSYKLPIKVGFITKTSPNNNNNNNNNNDK